MERGKVILIALINIAILVGLILWVQSLNTRIDHLSEEIETLSQRLAPPGKYPLKGRFRAERKPPVKREVRPPRPVTGKPRPAPEPEARPKGKAKVRPAKPAAKQPTPAKAPAMQKPKQ